MITVAAIENSRESIRTAMKNLGHLRSFPVFAGEEPIPHFDPAFRAVRCLMFYPGVTHITQASDYNNSGSLLCKLNSQKQFLISIDAPFDTILL